MSVQNAEQQTVNSIAGLIEQANTKAIETMLTGDPVLVDVVPAVEAIPELASGNTILHAGPPIEWQRMCGPMRGAVAGIAVFEGWADNLDDAFKKAEAGEFNFQPNHHYRAVGPMTGMTTKSQPLMVVHNRTFDNYAYCAINEGLGKVMRFGGNDAGVLKRLAWLRDTLAPMMTDALAQCDGIGLKNLIARGLTMGDEMHQRNVACSGLLLRELAPLMALVSKDNASLSEALKFMGGNDQFFLNVGMATGKALMDPVRDIEHSTIVTAMCRNGTDFGIRVSGLGDQWFTAPVEMPEGLYFAGFTEADANPDMGNAEWSIPGMDYLGVPTGIDIRKVVEVGMTPTINTGIAHKEPGIGQVGAGVVRAPMKCFNDALRAFAMQEGVA